MACNLACTQFYNITWRTIGYLNLKYQQKIKNLIIKETFRFILSASHQYFQNNLSGRISKQINTLADNIDLILHYYSCDFIRGFSLLLLAFSSAFYINPYFFYILLVWFIAFSSFSLFMSKELVELSSQHVASESDISGQLVDSISNVNNIRFFAQSSEEISRFQKYLLDAETVFQKRELFALKLHSGQGLLISIMLGFMIYFLIYFYEQHKISIGDFALILGLSVEVGHMTWYTMQQVDKFNQAIGKCKQSLSQLNISPEIQDIKNASHLLVTKGKITFAGVKFNYSDNENLFQNKSVIIEAGQKVGLVGHSGGGKTTFVNLILRLFDVVEGKILIDDQDIRKVTQESLRRQIAIIPQDPSLFHRTLMENIRYGRIDATDEEVIEAAKKANAHEFIKKLPEGYNSLVGERGLKLSGGQRQRIAIARAILKNARILILDEATSQLDSVTENQIQKSLSQLMQNKTSIIIAHRLSTLLNMDRILVFNQGEIVEDGSHSDLLANNSLYKKLWDAQVGGFLAN
ncbi:MAG: multidrug resistance transporter ATP-binding protein [Francisellaceae bacterium]|nr:multidrug resistance transporter ATP-binding protein [Francisellaceae bacterium]